jgi:hypothetical protein
MTLAAASGWVSTFEPARQNGQTVDGASLCRSQPLANLRLYARGFGPIAQIGRAARCRQIDVMQMSKLDAIPPKSPIGNKSRKVGGGEEANALEELMQGCIVRSGLDCARKDGADSCACGPENILQQHVLHLTVTPCQLNDFDALVTNVQVRQGISNPLSATQSDKKLPIETLGSSHVASHSIEMYDAGLTGAETSPNVLNSHFVVGALQDVDLALLFERAPLGGWKRPVLVKQRICGLELGQNSR